MAHDPLGGTPSDPTPPDHATVAPRAGGGRIAPGAGLTVAVDLLALAAFVVAGMRSHAAGSRLEVFARNAIPLGGAWIAVALALRTYRPPTLGRLLATWAIAVPAGVGLRAWWTGSPEGRDLAVFGAVALTFTLAFLGAGRLLVAWLSSKVGRGRAQAGGRPAQ